MKQGLLVRSTVVLGLVVLVCSSVAMAAKPSHTGYPRLMQGPMVGAVTDTNAKIWVRTSGAFTVAIKYDLTPDFKTAKQTEPVMVSKASDYSKC